MSDTPAFTHETIIEIPCAVEDKDFLVTYIGLLNNLHNDLMDALTNGLNQIHSVAHDIPGLDPFPLTFETMDEIRAGICAAIANVEMQLSDGVESRVAYLKQRVDNYTKSKN